MTMTATEAINGVTRNTHVLLGEVVSWSLKDNTRVPYSLLVSALQTCGLDEKVAREMLPRHAFARAAKQLEQDRIIRCVEDKEGAMLFQFTKEFQDASTGHYRYDYETTLRLDKDTGIISRADDAGYADPLVADAQRLLNEARLVRTTADITRYIMRLFEKQADLFPVRNAGGVYFVPERHVAFVDKIETFVAAVGGSITRFPVPAGTKQGDKSVKQAVQDGLKTLIDEHLKAIDDFGTDTRQSTMERQFSKIEQTKFKVELYAQYLDEQRAGLESSLAAVSLTLKQKIEQVLSAKAEAKNV